MTNIKTSDIPNVEEDVNKQKLLYISAVIVNRYNDFEKQVGIILYLYTPQFINYTHWSVLLHMCARI